MRLLATTSTVRPARVRDALGHVSARTQSRLSRQSANDEATAALVKYLVGLGLVVVCGCSGTAGSPAPMEELGVEPESAIEESDGLATEPLPEPAIRRAAATELSVAQLSRKREIDRWVSCSI